MDDIYISCFTDTPAALHRPIDEQHRNIQRNDNLCEHSPPIQFHVRDQSERKKAKKVEEHTRMDGNREHYLQHGCQHVDCFVVKYRYHIYFV